MSEIISRSSKQAAPDLQTCSSGAVPALYFARAVLHCLAWDLHFDAPHPKNTEYEDLKKTLLLHLQMTGDI